MPATITTPRLILRPWTDADLTAFVEMSNDPIVMRHLVIPQGDGTPNQRSLQFAQSFRAAIETKGFGRWVVEIPNQATFAGVVGLSQVAWTPPFPHTHSPCIEVVWRLASAHHGKGYATEAAKAAINFGFTNIHESHGYPGGLQELVAWTVEANTASRHVMEKLGMTWDRAVLFDHPAYPPGLESSRHVLYRLTRNQWQASRC